MSASTTHKNPDSKTSEQTKSCGQIFQLEDFLFGLHWKEMATLPVAIVVILIWNRVSPSVYSQGWPERASFSQYLKVACSLEFFVFVVLRGVCVWGAPSESWAYGFCFFLNTCFVCMNICLHVCACLEPDQSPRNFVDCHVELGNNSGPICGWAALVCLAPGNTVVSTHGWLQFWFSFVVVWLACFLSYALRSPGCLKTCSIDQSGFEPRDYLPLPPECTAWCSFDFQRVSFVMMTARCLVLQRSLENYLELARIGCVAFCHEGTTRFYYVMGCLGLRRDLFWLSAVSALPRRRWV